PTEARALDVPRTAAAPPLAPRSVTAHPPPPPLARLRPHQLYGWCGSSLLVAHPDGRVGGDMTGWYVRQTRFLSALALEVNGAAPFFCSSAEAAPGRLETAYVHPPVEKGGGGGSGSGASGSARGVLFRDIDLRL